MNAKSITFLT